MKYTELSTEAQKNAIKNYKDCDVFADLVNNYIVDDMQSRFNELVYNWDEYLNLEYSLNYSQGDGVSFSGELDEVQAKDFPFGKYVKDDTNIVIEFRRISHNYSHKNTVDIFIDFYGWDVENNGKPPVYDDNDIHNLEDAVQKYYNDVCDELERYGYDILDAYYSDEFVKDMLIDNEFDYFDEDGNIV